MWPKFSIVQFSGHITRYSVELMVISYWKYIFGPVVQLNFPAVSLNIEHQTNILIDDEHHMTCKLREDSLTTQYNSREKSKPLRVVIFRIKQLDQLLRRIFSDTGVKVLCRYHWIKLKF